MKGFKATNGASTTMPVPIAPPVIVSLRDHNRPVSTPPHQPNPDDHQGEEAIEFAEDARPSGESREKGSSHDTRPIRPTRLEPGPQLEPERHQHERLGRDVGHRPMRMETEKRIEHEQDAAIMPMRSSLIRAPHAKIATHPNTPTNMIGAERRSEFGGAPEDL